MLTRAGLIKKQEELQRIEKHFVAIEVIGTLIGKEYIRLDAYVAGGHEGSIILQGKDVASVLGFIRNLFQEKLRDAEPSP